MPSNTYYNNFIQLCNVWSRKGKEYLLIRRNPQRQSIASDSVALFVCPFTPGSITHSNFDQCLCTYYVQHQTCVWNKLQVPEFCTIFMKRKKYFLRYETLVIETGMHQLDYTGQITVDHTLFLDPDTLISYTRVFCSICLSCYFLH